MKMTMYSAFFLLFILSIQANSQLADFIASRYTLTACPVIDTIAKPQNYFQNFNIEVPPQEGGTLVLEFLGGAAGGLGGILIGSLVALPLIDQHPGHNVGTMIGNSVTIFLFAHIGYDLAVPIPITLIGNTKKVKGYYGSALLGTLVGNIASIAVVPLCISLNSSQSALLIAYLTPPIVGGMIGYSISRHWDEDHIRSRTDNLTNKQAQYTNSLMDRISIEGMSLSVRQNPYKLQPGPVTYLNLVNVWF
jgi:hypothetical protein